MDEDFHTLTNETEAKRIALEKLSDASQAYLKAISTCRQSFLFHSLILLVCFSLPPLVAVTWMTDEIPYLFCVHVPYMLAIWADELVA